MLDKYINVLKAHEKLIIAVLLLLSVLYGYNKWLNHSAQVAHDSNVVAQADLKLRQAENAKLAEIVVQALQNYQAVSSRVDQTNSRIDADIKARKQATVEQQKQDAVYPLPELADRWNKLLATNGAVAQPTGILADEPTARATVQTLELVPTLNDEIAGANKKLDGEKEKTAACEQANTALQNKVGGMDKELSTTKTACTSAINEVKAEARKSKLKWAKVGVIVGVVATEAIRFFVTGKP
jgi:hypothetical protein